MQNFWQGFVKQAAEAKEKPDGHHLRRFLLGNPASAAIEARKGEKTKAFGHAWAHAAKTNLKHTGIGAGGGALAGLAASALSKGKIRAGEGAGMGALVGGAAGNVSGAVQGNHGAEASRIHGENSKHKK